MIAPFRPQQPHVNILATEVLELGATLFEDLLDAAQSSGAEGQPFPADDARAAAEAFFDALCLLLKVEGPAQ